MNSLLERQVPVLNGQNYNQWAVAMQNFLMSQSLWHVLTDSCPPLQVVRNEAGEITSTTTSTERKDWLKDDEQAREHIEYRKPESNGVQKYCYGQVE